MLAQVLTSRDAVSDLGLSSVKLGGRLDEDAFGILRLQIDFLVDSHLSKRPWYQ